jgi:hypothetical protein
VQEFAQTAPYLPAAVPATHSGMSFPVTVKSRSLLPLLQPYFCLEFGAIAYCVKCSMPYYAITSYVPSGRYPLYFQIREAKLPSINFVILGIA